MVDTEGFKEYFLYNSTFPKLLEDYFTKKNPTKSLSSNNWDILKMFLSARNIQGLQEGKLVKCFFESINTLWYVCLEIFIKNKTIQIDDSLYSYAFNKVFNIEAEGQMINMQILSTVAYLNGYFGNQNDFDKLTRKYSKTITAMNFKCGLQAKYYTGMKHKNDFLKLFKEEKNDLACYKIPTSVSTHFETNQFCSVCNMYIPEELILAKFSSDHGE